MTDDPTDPEGPRAPSVSAVDGHAHFHPAFSGGDVLEAAAGNFRRWGPDAADSPPGGGRPPAGCLLLADPGDGGSMEALCASVDDDPRWEVRATGEEISRLAVRGDGARVALVAGRQIATADGLEVLALATDAEIPGGRPARETVEASLREGAVTVLPWGFGKWWLRRGRVARALLESVDHPLFFLGDNGGRPRIAPEPPLFRAARRRGTAVLPGSDPLPFRREQERVGSYGFLLGPPPAEPGRARPRGRDGREGTRPGGTGAPAAALRSALHGLSGGPPTFGRRAGVGRFVLHQAAMQLRKRRTG